jgi:hypothetical protein
MGTYLRCFRDDGNGTVMDLHGGELMHVGSEVID